MGEARVFVVSGPSGVGKGTLIKRVLDELEGFHLAVSATTRPPADEEVDGRDYHFLTDRRFDELIEEDGLLEWEEVYGNRYGTLKSEVNGALSRGEKVLLELDVKGALTVRLKMPEAILVFIMPSSVEVLENRLRGRSRDPEEDIGIRMAQASEEIEVGRSRFDVIIVNDDLEEAATRLKAVFKGE